MYIYIHTHICIYIYIYICNPRRCKTSFSWSERGSVLSSFLGSICKNPRTQIYMVLSFIDPQARVLNYCFK